ncbi:MAG: Pantoate--beta-alanine ligase [Cytophagales bacterium]|jgi:pantoate--beta-alanine ligase|nr:pantoate--beta-alanine ligase [Bacteroidota bacterium]MBS1980404.1 pantoate--beta-alanine ligase [Bacteroidota bacterium]WHZ07718.1 MAG: Pantoate--beta-alanine ligase [Cytophagales bacterium]
MEIFKEIKPLKAFLKEKTPAATIGLVPTMGALHHGHLSLIEASKRENALTVSTIFVNPAQFNNPEDLKKYPRTLERDCEMLRQAGCQVVFAPEVTTLYEHEPTVTFDFGTLDKILEGKFRPGHFSGVALVVSKLFHIVNPTTAYFGQKDFQQFKIIEKLVEELKFDLQLKMMPIIREPDGLALSSRNKRLSEPERKKAALLFRSLTEAKKLLIRGEKIFNVKEIVNQNYKSVDGVKLEYFELANIENLSPAETVTNQTILLMAAYVGEVRLIDNLLMEE